MGGKTSQRLKRHAAPADKGAKKVGTHNRQIQKQVKKNSNSGALKRDPGVPNLACFKTHLEGKKKRAAGEVVGYAAMAESNAQREKDFDGVERVAQAHAVGEQTRKAFFRELRVVIEASDIIVEVLDARDPNSCRCPALERELTERGKKVVLVVNKIDLVPAEATIAWLAHLRREYPTVAFKAARTSKSGGAVRPVHANTKAETANAGLLQSSFGVLGADTLIQLLKNYSRIGQDKKRAVTVGIIGYPNVGKSSLINSLKRTCCAKVGGSAGVTKCKQEIQLDAKLTLIDSPGVVFAGNSNDAAVVLRNAGNAETLTDPIGAVGALLEQAPWEAVRKHFDVDQWQSPVGFLTQVARNTGKLKRGGAANHEAAARLVLGEWTSGKLRYYVMPPVTHGVVEENAALASKATLVKTYGEALDIDALMDGDQRTLSALDVDEQMAGPRVTTPESAEPVPMEIMIDA